MRYVYYIIGILIVITVAASWGRLTDTKVEFSKPAIVVNDRIITDNEFKNLIKSKPSYQAEEEFIDSVIIKELLIQEAIKRGINKDEIFRQSVEDFYEQSLIKILMDNQYEQYNPMVADKEIEKFKTLAGQKIFLSKIIYASKDDVGKNKSKKVKSIESDFLDLSSSLRFTVFTLKPGESSEALKTIEGFVVYEFIKYEKINNKDTIKLPASDRIASFLKNGKKAALLEKWVNGIKENAEIWRRK